MKKTTTKRSIAEVALAVKAGSKFSYELADWLDEFYYAPEQDTLHEEPCTLTNTVKNGDVIDAYLAATASQLCKKHGWKLPAWVWGKTRVLKDPWFAEPHPFLRATLLLESPSSFRERNLFVSANALHRA